MEVAVLGAAVVVVVGLVGGAIVVDPSSPLPDTPLSSAGVPVALSVVLEIVVAPTVVSTVSTACLDTDSSRNVGPCRLRLGHVN